MTINIFIQGITACLNDLPNCFASYSAKSGSLVNYAGWASATPPTIDLVNHAKKWRKIKLNIKGQSTLDTAATDAPTKSTPC